MPIHARGVDLVYYAKTGAVVERDGKNVLVMNDGVVHRKLAAGDVSVIRFSILCVRPVGVLRDM